MDSILVVGSDTTVGANLTARWAQQSLAVRGLPWSEIDADPAATGWEGVRSHLIGMVPERLVYCDSAAALAWSCPEVTAQTEARLRIWSRAVRELGCRFTYLTSDAVFSGPWLFHAEESRGYCSSPEARRLRAMEELVLRVLPEALVVRSAPFGFSPGGDGWIERNLSRLEQGCSEADPLPHATPILASDLADILCRAHEESIAGLLHVAGAERLSQAEFLSQLAREFDLPLPNSPWNGTLSAPAEGFGMGETSLRTVRVKNLLNLAMPNVRAGLRRLREQGWEWLEEPADLLQRAA